MCEWQPITTVRVAPHAGMRMRIGKWLWWGWYITAIIVGGMGLVAVLLNDLGTVTHFGVGLTPEMRSAIYTLMIVESGWQIWARMNCARPTAARPPRK